MMNSLKLMCILAHPDDESLGTGGILARYAAEGIETSLLTATRGEQGWPGPAETYPGATALGRLREAELHAAAEILNVREVALLDYQDGEMIRAEPAPAVGRIVGHLRRIRPDVVVTFDMFGSYGHPDHIAIAQWATAAVSAAAHPGYEDDEQRPVHQVQKLYYMAPTDRLNQVYQEIFGELVMDVEGQARLPVAWPDWSITSWIDAEGYWEQVWEAIQCHQTQLPATSKFRRLTAEQRHVLWGRQSFYRVFSLVNGDPRESDLFAGLR